MHVPATVDAALRLSASGASAPEIARSLAVPRSTVREWLTGCVPHVPAPNEGEACLLGHAYHDLPPAYLYLLGLYLGDGCISQNAKGVAKLRLSMDGKYPGILGGAITAILAVRPSVVGSQYHPKYCIEVYSYWTHWPCLFPQHGAGKKHTRRIVLTDWQERLADRWPEHPIAGLIDSDGCRFENTGTKWTWPRYAFKQVSADIRSIFCVACDRLALRWTAAGDAVYVSRKTDVSKLDSIVGPKR